MKYKYQFFNAGKPFTELCLHGNAPSSVASAIDRVLDAFNYHLDKTNDPSLSIKKAIISLMSDENKSAHIKTACAQHPVPGLNSTSDLFDYLTRLATHVGLELVISKNELLSLSTYAANVVERHRFLYADRLDIKQMPATLLAKYPNMHIDAQEYIKTRMRHFLDSYLLKHLQTKVVLALRLLSSMEPADLYKQIHKLLTDIDYKNTLTQSFKKTLISPILMSMKALRNKDISAEAFAESSQSIIANYQSEDAGELKFLLRLEDILLKSAIPAKDLHALLQDKEYPLTQTFVPTLRKPLIQIIKDFNQFVVQLNNDKAAYQVQAGR